LINGQKGFLGLRTVLGQDGMRDQFDGQGNTQGDQVKALKDASQGFPSKVGLLFAVQGVDLNPVYLVGPAGAVFC
jgi:hypothetical protein